MTRDVSLAIARRVSPRIRMAMHRYPRLAAAARGSMDTVLNTVLPGGFRELRLAAGPLAGSRMVLDLTRDEERRFWLSLHERWVQHEIVRRLRPGQTAWDIGAYIGYHTLLMRKTSVTGEVVAVEPHPTTRVRLEQNLKLNGADHAVTIVPMAIAERPGTIRMLEHGDRPAHNCVDPEGELALPATTLDQLLDQFGPPSLVKMDVERSEDLALAGGRRLLEEVRPIWIIELHGGDHGRRALEQLDDCDYLVRGMTDVPPAEQLAHREHLHVVAEPRTQRD
jgi:FkbM family methyltransferase